MRLRLQVHDVASECERRRLAAEELSSRLGAARIRGVASPWSGLVWRVASTELDDVLEPVRRPKA
jgi:hypothetical protein